jgi:tetratricopeptide (TPR) repeat protein
VADNPRIDELRRRVQKDPASIAFAQLAEEHRRAGQYDEAIEVARAGLQQHPAYLSARVTLGRALIELGRLDEAAAEFESVVKAAPDNLTAVRQLADIHQRRRQRSSDTKSKEPDTAAPPAAPTPLAASPVPAPRPAPLPPTPSSAPVVPLGPSGTAEVIHVAERMPAAAVDVEAMAPQQPGLDAADAVIVELEAWLAVIESERAARSASSAERR